MPLMFAGERDEIRYAAALPPRVQEGGAWFFRLAVARDGDKSRLVLERTYPDPTALENPQFNDAERSVLADGIAELKISYFGRDANAADADTPTWRDRWDDRQRLPLLVQDRSQAGEGPGRGRRSSSSRGAHPSPRARPTTRSATGAWGRFDASRAPPVSSQFQAASP